MRVTIIFDYIHQTIPGIVPVEKVALPDHREIVVNDRELLGLEKMGQTTYISSTLQKEAISSILNFFSPCGVSVSKSENFSFNIVSTSFSLKPFLWATFLISLSSTSVRLDYRASQHKFSVTSI